MIVPEEGYIHGPSLSEFADDTTQGSYRLPGMIYGVNDSRRPAGLASGE